MFIRRRASNLVSYSAALTLLGLGAAQATTFSTPAGALGSVQAYGDITAYGFFASLSGPNSGNLVAHNLFGKTDGGGETGLGLVAFDNEINSPAGSQAIASRLRGSSAFRILTAACFSSGCLDVGQ